MFDFAWSEFALIGVVALILIGPKDMPVAIKAITDMIKKARRMAAEFQTHVDEMVRDTSLQEVRDQINELRNFDIKGEMEKAVDPDGSLRQTFATNPLEPAAATYPADEHEIGAAAEHTIERPEGVDETATAAAFEAPPPAEAAAPPAFIPPGTALLPEPEPPPAFIPPAIARASRG
jgi:sec-independent protein translocase protein TatB